jgi:hypothetical protein
MQLLIRDIRDETTTACITAFHGELSLMMEVTVGKMVIWKRERNKREIRNALEVLKGKRYELGLKMTQEQSNGRTRQKTVLHSLGTVTLVEITV